MTLDVMYSGDHQSLRDATSANPAGRIVKLPHRFTARDMSNAIIAAAENTQGSVATIRFRRIPFRQIFQFPSDSPLLNGLRPTDLSPEESDLVRLNDYFAPGNAQVHFFKPDTQIERSFLINPALRMRIWPRVARYCSFQPDGRTHELDFSI